MDISRLISRMVSITQFNKGKASQLFNRANKGETLLVIKNNTPVAVILSPKEYEILREIPRACIKACEEGTYTKSRELVSLIDTLKTFDGGDQHV